MGKGGETLQTGRRGCAKTRCGDGEVGGGGGGRGREEGGMLKEGHQDEVPVSQGISHSPKVLVIGRHQDARQVMVRALTYGSTRPQGATTSHP